MSSGYSKTPLVKKLGYKPGFQILIVSEPAHYWELMTALPEGIESPENPEEGAIDFIHLFVTEKSKLISELERLKPFLRLNGTFWISWPKGKSKIPADLNGNDVRQLGLAAGLVDVKVAAIDDDWSGLKFVYRLVDRS